MKPVLIITRPAPDGARFASEVTGCVDVSVIMSPLQKIVPVVVECDAEAFIFTSTNGVAQAARLGLAGGRAWCVGDRTAQMAQEAGFNAVSAQGNAEDLIKLVLAQKPLGKLAHIRGGEARGDIAPRLTAAGILCADVIAYAQLPISMTSAALAAIGGVSPVIIPLFSPRAAILLLSQARIGPHVTLIAMSKAVADQLGDLPVQVLGAPSGDAMLTQVIAACRKLQSS